MIIKYSVGLDVSAADIKACISVIDIEQRVKVQFSKTHSNTKKGLLELYNWIIKSHKSPEIPLVVCMEATGVYHENSAYFLLEKGLRISIVLPNKAKKYLQALGLKSKNDKIDAKGLAQMGAEQNLKEWKPLGNCFYDHRTLTRHHEVLQKNFTSEKNRLHAAETAARQVKIELTQIKQLITFLKKQLAIIEVEIHKMIETNPTYKDKFARVCKLHGIATLSAATIIAETGGFELFENYKQVVSYAGYDVVENQSGKHQGKTKISKKGNSKIRRILHMPALVARGKEGTVFEKLYTRVFEKTGIKMKGIVAVQKKLLLMIYYIWKKDLIYDINFSNIQKEELAPPSPLKIDKEKQLKKATYNVASQGEHPLSYRSMPPLRKANILKNVV